jgi:hypothetical protein
VCQPRPNRKGRNDGESWDDNRRLLDLFVDRGQSPSSLPAWANRPNHARDRAVARQLSDVCGLKPNASAPGQVTLREMNRRLSIPARRKIDQSSGIVGHPVGIRCHRIFTIARLASVDLDLFI